jgi:hypothetical protein
MKTAKQNAGAELLRAALAHSDVYNSGDYDGLAGCLARAELELAVDHYRDAKSEPAVSVALSVDTSKALAQLDEVIWRLSEIQRIAGAFAVPVQMLAGPIPLPRGQRTPHETFVLANAIAWYNAYKAVADGTEPRRAQELASSVGRMLDA